MSAMFWVTFDNGTMLTVYSADAKSMKAKDVRASYAKARKKGEAKYRKHAPRSTAGARVTNVRCVG